MRETALVTSWRRRGKSLSKSTAGKPGRCPLTGGRARDIPRSERHLGAGRPTDPRRVTVLDRRRASTGRHLREAEGLSIAQIADRLGCSPATIKVYSYDRLMLTKDLRIARRNVSSGRLLVMHGPRSASRAPSALAATARGRRSLLPDLSGCGSLERRYSGPRYCP